jgi:hypothetical protein
MSLAAMGIGPLVAGLHRFAKALILWFNRRQ